MSWQQVPDTHVRHIWRDSAGTEHIVSPDYYESNGEPYDASANEVMTYVRTEVFTPEEQA